MTKDTEGRGTRDSAAIMQELADHIGQTVGDIAGKGLTTTHQYYRGDYDFSSLPDDVKGWAQMVAVSSQKSMSLLTELTRSMAPGRG